MISKEQKAEVKQRPAIRKFAQSALQEVYHYFRTVHGTQPPHKEVVKLVAELMEDEHKVGQGGH